MPFSKPESIHEAFAAAFSSGDVDALVQLYEADAVQLQPDGKTVLTGSDQLKAGFQHLIDAGLIMSGTQRTTVVAGDLALTSTRYEFDAAGPDDAGGTKQAITAEVSRRQPDGTWRVVIDAPMFG